MNRNFYLQHPLMAMYDPRIENLINREGLKGLGAYWIIMEKLALMPECYADLEYLRPFCKSMKVSFAYIKKIILNYGLFYLYENGYFEPEELNPPCKKEQKTSENVSEYEVSEAKNDEKRQKTSLNEAKTKENISSNSLKQRVLAKNSTDNTKEYIKDITTTATTEEKEETAAAADNDFGLSSETDAGRKPLMLFRLPKAQGGVCPFGTASRMPQFTASPMTHFTAPNDAPHRPKPRSSAPPKCVIWSG